jgi:hypothetical protein
LESLDQARLTSAGGANQSHDAGAARGNQAKGLDQLTVFVSTAYQGQG